MERGRKINSEQGEADSRILIMGFIAVIALVRICNVVAELQEDVKDLKNNLATPTPTPAGIDINSFENTFNSGQLTPTPEPTS